MQISDFRPLIVPDVPGCPDEMIRVAVVRAARQLCNEAKVWRELQDPQPLVSGEAVYEPDAPPGALVEGVSEVWVGNTQLTRKTMEELQAVLPDWRTAESTSPMFFNSPEDASRITVYPRPRNPTLSIAMRAWFTPRLTAETLPDVVLLKREQTMIHGTLATLMAMPKRNWTDPALAAYHLSKFQTGIIDARIAMLHEQAGGSVHVVRRRFA